MIKFSTRICLIVITAVYILAANVSIAYATFDWLDDPPSATGHVLKKPQKAIEESSASLYQTVFTGCIAALVIDTCFVGVQIALYRDRSK